MIPTPKRKTSTNETTRRRSNITRASGGLTTYTPTGEEIPQYNAQGTLAYKPTTLNPLEQQPDGRYMRVDRNADGNQTYFDIARDGADGVDYHTDPKTGEQIVHAPEGSGGTRRVVIGQDPWIPAANSAESLVQSHQKDVQQAATLASRAEQGISGGQGYDAQPLSQLSQQHSAALKALTQAQQVLYAGDNFRAQGGTFSVPQLVQYRQAQDVQEQYAPQVQGLQTAIAARQNLVTSARQQHADSSEAMQMAQGLNDTLRSPGGRSQVQADLAKLDGGVPISTARAQLFARAGLVSQEPQTDGSLAWTVTDAGKTLLPKPQAVAPPPPARAPQPTDASIQQSTTVATPTVAPASPNAASQPQPYTIGQDGTLQLDQSQPVASTLAAYKAGLVGDNQIKDLLPKAQAAEEAAKEQDRIAKENPAAWKAFTSGAVKAGGFLAASAPGAAIGGEIGAFGGPLDPITIPAGAIIGGLITGSLGSHAVDATMQTLGKHSETIQSFVDASKLHPNYDTAGNLVAFGAGLPKVATAALSRGAAALAGEGTGFASRVARGTAENYAHSGGLADTVKNLYGEGSIRAANGATGLQVATGVAGRVAGSIGANVAIDTAIKEGAKALGLSDEGQTLDGATQAALIGVFAAGHNVKIGGYDSQGVSNIVNVGTIRRQYGLSPTEGALPPEKIPAGLDQTTLEALQNPLSKREAEVLDRFGEKITDLQAKGKLSSTLTEQEKADILSRTTARQATTGGNSYGVTAVDVAPADNSPNLAPGSSRGPSSPQAPTDPALRSSSSPAGASPVSPSDQPASPGSPTQSGSQGQEGKSPSPTGNDTSAAGQAPAVGDTFVSGGVRYAVTSADGENVGIRPETAAADAPPLQIPRTHIDDQIRSGASQLERAPVASPSPIPVEPAPASGESTPTTPAAPDLERQEQSTPPSTPAVDSSSPESDRAASPGDDSTKPQSGSVLPETAPTPEHHALAALADSGAESDRADGKSSTAFKVLARLRDFGAPVTSETARDVSARVAEIRADTTLDEAGKGAALRQVVQDHLPTEAHETPTSTIDSVRGDKLDSRRTAFHPDSGTLGIPRDQMPQVAAEHRGAMANFLKARGMGVSEADILPGDLKPSQAEFNPGKVAKAGAIREAGDATQRRILVSNDGHVVDGHHQWLDRLANTPDQPMKALKIDAPARDILKQIHEFPSAGMEKAPDLAEDGNSLQPTTGNGKSAVRIIANHEERVARGEKLTAGQEETLAVARRALAKDLAAQATPAPASGLPTMPEASKTTGTAMTPAGKEAERIIGRLSARSQAGEVLTPAQQESLANARYLLHRDLNRQALGANPQPTSEAGKQALAAIQKFQQARTAGAQLTPSDHAAFANHQRVLEGDFIKQRLAMEAKQAAPTPTFQPRQEVMYQGRRGAIESIDGDRAVVCLEAGPDPKTGETKPPVKKTGVPLSVLEALPDAEAGGGRQPAEPIHEDAARQVAETQIEANRSMLNAMGVRRVEYGDTKAESGVEFANNGTLLISPSKLAASMTDVRDIQAGQAGALPGTPEDWFSQVLVHEGIHAADVAVAKAKGQTIRQRYEALSVEAMPEGWEKAARDVYGPKSWDGLEDWQKKAEFVRQVIEGKYSGRLTEQLYRFMHEALAYFKGMAGFENADPRFKAHVAEVEARIEAARPSGTPAFRVGGRATYGGRAATIQGIDGDTATIQLKGRDEPVQVPVSALKPPVVRSFEMPDAPMGVPDVLDHIKGEGGMVSPKAAQGKATFDKRTGDYDGAPTLNGYYHHAVYKAGSSMMPDQMATLLHENYGVGDGSEDGMWKAVQQAVDQRRSNSSRQKTFAVQEKQATSFEKDALAEGTAKGGTAINAADLNVGDHVTIGNQKLKVAAVDPDTLDVTLEDHSKYGVQKVADGTALYVEKVEPGEAGDDSTLAAARPDRQTGNLFPEDDPFDLRGDLPTEAERVAAARSAARQPASAREQVPTIRPGAKGTGDLFQGDDAPFNLVGETGIDGEAVSRERAQAERDATEAREKQERDQGSLFAGKPEKPASARSQTYPSELLAGVPPDSRRADLLREAYANGELSQSRETGLWSRGPKTARNARELVTPAMEKTLAERRATLDADKAQLRQSYTKSGQPVPENLLAERETKLKARENAVAKFQPPDQSTLAAAKPEDEQLAAPSEGRVDPTRAGSIKDLVDETTGPEAPERRRFVGYGTVNAEQAAQLKAATGLDLEGYRRNLDNSTIRHVLKNHGDPAKEIARGNAPLNKADFEKLPELLERPDASMYAGKNQYGQDLIASAKRVNGHWIIVEEARDGKQVLNLTTIYKKSARPLVDDAAPEGTTPSLTPEAIQSTARRILQQVIGQRNVEGTPKESSPADVTESAPKALTPNVATDGLAVGDRIDISKNGTIHTVSADDGGKMVSITGPSGTVRKIPRSAALKNRVGRAGEEDSSTLAAAKPEPEEKPSRIEVPRKPGDSDDVAAARKWMADQREAGEQPSVNDLVATHGSGF